MLTVNSKRWLYRVALFLFCGVLSMMFTSLDAPTTQAKPLQQDLSNYRFIHHIGRNDLCLEVTGSSTASGARVELQDCFYTADDKDSQLWRFEDQSNGFALIRARHSNMCLGVEGNSTALAAYINQYPCNSSNDSHFWKYTYDAAKERLVQIKNKRSNFCLINIYGSDWPNYGDDLVQGAKVYLVDIGPHHLLKQYPNARLIPAADMYYECMEYTTSDMQSQPCSDSATDISNGFKLFVPIVVIQEDPQARQ